MIQSLRQIKNSIRGIENAKKVTNAMQMISVAKLNRINKTFSAGRHYQEQLGAFLQSLANSREKIENHYFEQRGGRGPIVLCVIASDNGLCGPYNQTLLRAAEEFIFKHGNDRVSLIVIGKKAAHYFKSRAVCILHTYLGLNGNYSVVVSDEIAGILAKLFLSKKADEVYVAYTYYKRGIMQQVAVEKFLNLERVYREEKAEYILEEDFEALLEKLAFSHIIAKMRLMLLQAFTAEHAARSMAMKSATENAEEMLGDLIMSRNKARQANITQQMLEIISSKEALKG
jgi:F-type H+-transporting ATPase subunit gamma